MDNLPCENCITLPVCVSIYKEPKSDMICIPKIQAEILISQKCSLLVNYFHSEITNIEQLRLRKEIFHLFMDNHISK